MPDLDPFRSMLADAETALDEGGDEAEWALQIPVPILADDLRDDRELVAAVFADAQLAQRYTRVLRKAAQAHVELEARS